MAELPAPEQPGRYRLAVVCLGNICRSPMAHVVLEHRLEQAGLDDRVVVTSSGTGGWHTGQPMDERAAATLRAHGYDPSKHVARQFSTDWYAENDLLLVINAALLRLTAWVAGQVDVGFHVEGFWTAVGGALVITVVSWFFTSALGDD